MIRRFAVTALPLAIGLAMLLSRLDRPAAAQRGPAPQAGPSLALPSDEQWKGAASTNLDQPPAPAPAPAPAPGQMLERATQLASRYNAVDYDPVLRAKELGAGIDPSFLYVRDQIRFEAYPGVLRGASGAYINRAANAPDRSLLLAKLLEQKGVKTRFAMGKLPRDKAEVLFNRMFEPAKPVAPGAGPGAAAEPARKAEFVDRIRARAFRDYATIRTALGDKLPAAVSPSRDDVVKEIEAHVWLQAHAEGKWIDLDTAFPDAAAGTTYCAIGQTADKLPDDLHQRVTIRLVVERLDGARLVPETVLELKRPAVELLENHVFLLHAPVDGMTALGSALSGGKKDWVPALWIDGDITAGKGFAYEDAAAGDKAAPNAGAGLGGALDALDISGAAPAATGAPFVAETLEFEITLPGGKSETVRRVLCDRGGPAWRRTMPLSAATLKPLPRDAQGPLPPQSVCNIWLSGGGMDLADYAKSLRLLATMRPPQLGQPRSAPESAAKPAVATEQEFEQLVWPVALQNRSLVLFGDHMVAPSLNDDPAARFYVDSPRILLFHLRAKPDPADPKRISFSSEIDLRRDKLRGVAKDASAAGAVALRKIWYCALEGAMEHEAIALQAALVGADARTVSSTSALVDGRGAKVLLPGSVPAAWEQLAADRDTAARLAASAADGDVVVVPAGVLEPGTQVGGWWAINSATGHARAVVGEGLMGRFDFNGAGRPGATNWVDPATGAGRPPPGEGPVRGPGARARGGGGGVLGEYAMQLWNIIVAAAPYILLGGIIAGEFITAVWLLM